MDFGWHGKFKFEFWWKEVMSPELEMTTCMKTKNYGQGVRAKLLMSLVVSS